MIKNEHRIVVAPSSHHHSLLKYLIIEKSVLPLNKKSKGIFSKLLSSLFKYGKV